MFYSLRKKISSESIPSLLILITFFMSGCAALIYQVVWQRYLFTALGVDVDSVTLIVSTFMLGIGVGGACGGWIADSFPRARLKVYAFCELMLACVGAASPLLFHGIQDFAATGVSYAGVSILSVALVFLPTFVMGLTLPVLTLYFDESLSNVGVSVGMLYFFNTLGAAFGAWLTANVFFMYLGLNASAWGAAVLNLLCFGIVCYCVIFLRRARL